MLKKIDLEVALPPGTIDVWGSGSNSVEPVSASRGALIGRVMSILPIHVRDQLGPDNHSFMKWHLTRPDGDGDGGSLQVIVNWIYKPAITPLSLWDSQTAYAYGQYRIYLNWRTLLLELSMKTLMGGRACLPALRLLSPSSEDVDGRMRLPSRAKTSVQL